MVTQGRGIVPGCRVNGFAALDDTLAVLPEGCQSDGGPEGWAGGRAMGMVVAFGFVLRAVLVGPETVRLSRATESD